MKLYKPYLQDKLTLFLCYKIRHKISSGIITFPRIFIKNPRKFDYAYLMLNENENENNYLRYIVIENLLRGK